MHAAEQARELWCPMVRIARREVITPAEIKHTGVGEYFTETLAIVGGCNTDALGRLRVPKSCRCIANECAMWRWLPEPPAATVSIGIGLVTEELPRIPTERRGYCGLAPIHHTT